MIHTDIDNDDRIECLVPDDETVLNLMFVVKEWMRDIQFPTEIPIMAITYCFNRLERLLQQSSPVKPIMRGTAWECGKCNQILGIVGDDRRDSYCRSCGAKADWGNK